MPLLIKDIFTLCRPQQWIKNGFVFLPLFFSGNLFHLPLFIATFLAFIAFSLAASGIYALNDCIDREADAIHPIKRNRPVAAGRISPRQAITITFTLSVTALILPALTLPALPALYTASIIAIYILLNIAYSLRLKSFPLIDVFIIAVGFVLRVVAGGTAASIPISHWIVIMTFLLALFLALCKRRDDISIFENSGKKMRLNIDMYNLAYINQAITLVATIMLVSYIMYTLSPEVIARFDSELLYITSIFVLAGLLRYMQLATVYGKTGSPTKVLLRDRFIQLCILLWAITFALIIYL